MANLKRVGIHTEFAMGLKRPQRTVTADATLTIGDWLVLVDTAAGIVTVTLGMTAAELVGQTIWIVDVDTGFAANDCVIATAGAETIDGAATLTLTADDDNRIIYSDGTNFFTLDGLS